MSIKSNGVVRFRFHGLEALEDRIQLSGAHPAHHVAPSAAVFYAPEAAVTGTLTVDANPPTLYGTAMTFTARFTTTGDMPVGQYIRFFSSGKVSGLAAFTDGFTPFGEVLLNAEGVAVLTIPAGTAKLNLGVQSIVARFNPTPTIVSAPVAMEVTRAATSIAFNEQSSAESTYFKEFDLSAIVTRETVGTGAIAVASRSSRVTFYLGSTSGIVLAISYDHMAITTGNQSVFTATVSGGDALKALLASDTPHTIVAVYSGNDGNLPSTSSVNDPAAAHTINRVAPVITISGGYHTYTISSVFSLQSVLKPNISNGFPEKLTGTISFTDNGNPIGGPVALTIGASSDAGVAVLPGVSLNAGNHVITATYSGDSNYLPVTASFNQTIAPGYVSLTPRFLYRTYGETSQLTVSTYGLNPADPLIQPIELLDGDTVYTAPIGADGIADFSFLTNVTAGYHTFIVRYPGDANHLSYSTIESVPVGQATSRVVFIADPPQAVPGQDVTLTAIVTNRSNANTYGSPPGGVVDFYDDYEGYDLLGSVELDATGKAVLIYHVPINYGSHGLSAEYSGDDNFSRGYNDSYFEVVYPSAITLTGDEPSVYGDEVTFTAAVTSPVGVPEGTITFFDGDVAIGTVAVEGEETSFTTAALTGGVHAITARYEDPDGEFVPSSDTVGQIVHTAATTLVLAPVDAAHFGADIPFTVTLDSSAGPASPTGVIEVHDEHGNTVASGQADGLKSYTLIAPAGSIAPGQHTYTAMYSGDSSFSESTSTSQRESVSNVHVAVTLSAHSVAFGGTATLTATATAPGSGSAHQSGLFGLYENGVQIATAQTNVNGAAVFELPQFEVGQHHLTARFFNSVHAASAAATLNIIKVHPTAALALSAVSEPYLNAITITATVTATGFTPTGIVTLHNGTHLVASATLVNGVAQFVESSLTPGDHKLSIAYLGDDHFNAVTSAVAHLTVLKLTPVVQVKLSKSNAAFGGVVTVDASVTSGIAGQTPGGTIDILDNGVVIATGHGPDFSVDRSTFTTGQHQITAAYHGDSRFNAASTTSATTLTIDKPIPSAVLSVSPSSESLFKPVTFTMNVSSILQTPTGTVTVYDGANPLTTIPLAHGAATYTSSSLTSGAHTLSFQYNGDTHFAPITSNAISQTIKKLASTAALTFSSATPIFGEQVLLTATITAPPGAPVPTGQVVFSEGTALNKTVTLTNGVATFLYNPARGGYHGVTLSYAGDSQYNASSDYEFFSGQPITPTVTLTSSAQNIAAGQPVTFTAQVTGLASALPTGYLVLFVGNVNVSFTLTNGLATFTTSTLTAGTYSIDAIYFGNESYTSTSTHMVLNVV